VDAEKETMKNTTKTNGCIRLAFKMDLTQEQAEKLVEAWWEKGGGGMAMCCQPRYNRDTRLYDSMSVAILDELLAEKVAELLSNAPVLKPSLKSK